MYNREHLCILSLICVDLGSNNILCNLDHYVSVYVSFTSYVVYIDKEKKTKYKYNHK